MKKIILAVILVTGLFGFGYESYAKQTLASRLKDSESAKFKNLTLSSKKVVCGQVNAKNAYGGYTGYNYFIGAGNLSYFQSDFKNYKEFDKTWNALCDR